jgi:iron complex outermembrane receptor protein
VGQLGRRAPHAGLGANVNFSRYSLAGLQQRQFSQELQAVGSAGKFDYVFGLYYFNERASDWARTPNTNKWNAALNGYTINDPSTYLSATLARASTAYAKSYAAYGQVTYNPFDPLHITVGGRYTKDDKNGLLYTVNGAATNFTFDQSNNRFDPLVVLAYEVNPDINVYAKYATGYRAGGASSRSLNYRSFGPESVKSYEVGLKSEFFDRKVRFNVAGYIMDRTTRRWTSTTSSCSERHRPEHAGNRQRAWHHQDPRRGSRPDRASGGRPDAGCPMPTPTPTFRRRGTRCRKR